MPENNIHKEKQKPFTPPNKLTHGIDKLYRNTSLGDGAGAESAAVADAAPNTATVVEYPLPVQEFAVTRYDLPAGTTVSTQLPGPAIALATSGVVTVNDLELAPGEAA